MRVRRRQGLSNTPRQGARGEEKQKCRVKEIANKSRSRAARPGQRTPAPAAAAPRPRTGELGSQRVLGSWAVSRRRAARCLRKQPSFNTHAHLANDLEVPLLDNSRKINSHGSFEVASESTWTLKYFPF